MEAPINGGSNSNCPKVAKILVVDSISPPRLKTLLERHELGIMSNICGPYSVRRRSSNDTPLTIIKKRRIIMMIVVYL